ncbi:MAG: acetyl-CoA carboxylase biotin carboxylase subunit [Bacteroidales bacterium]|nr:acetyl-CoA carboxylase biotin carboxylase subunit [Bacteroidales bacterium]
MMQLFNKILIANRGEIAVRIARSAKELGIPVAAVYSEVDRDSMHVKLADEIYHIGHSDLSETYLNIDKIIGIAISSGCDAIHPGYGFLAENPEFVRACEVAGLKFIGPSSEVIQLMGNKIEARNFMSKLGIPLVGGHSGDTDELIAKANDIGYPVLVKAAAGGGGKGMQIVSSPEDLLPSLIATSREALAYFGDGQVYIEKYIEQPRHIEFQIIGDHFGNIIHLFERECSVQRRYQKIIEEAPSPTLTADVREKMAETAIKIGMATGYTSAGTIEFLVDADLNFYFLEMNTRIQVEHPVTEMITGVDIVKEQILIAAGNPLGMNQKAIKINGHAIEARIYAEDPAKDFMPSPGKMTLYKQPEIEGVRVDSGVSQVTEIKSFYDPMVCKLIIHGHNRSESIRKMILALEEFKIHGIRTNIQYLKKLFDHPDYIKNKISTSFCDEHTEEIISQIIESKEEVPVQMTVAAFLLKELFREYNNQSVWQRIGFWRFVKTIPLVIDEVEYQVYIRHQHFKHIIFEINNKKYFTELNRQHTNSIEFSLEGKYVKAYFSQRDDGKCDIETETHLFVVHRKDVMNDKLSFEHEDLSLSRKTDAVFSPMPGKVIKVCVEAGQDVSKGDTLMIIEAMKMENLIKAPRDGILQTVHVDLGQQTESGQLLISLKGEE